MNDPRKTDDPLVREALVLWDSPTFNSSEVQCATRDLHERLRPTPHHQAFGWAALACARHSYGQGTLNATEVFLAEAAGRFLVADDLYGTGLATAYLAGNEMERGNLDRAVALARQPFSSGVEFRASDSMMLHNIAANIYWTRDELHDALGHLVRVQEIAVTHQIPDPECAVLANIGVVLLSLGEFELSLKTSVHAWRVQLNNRAGSKNINLKPLSNTIAANIALERFDEALLQSEILHSHLEGQDRPGNWNLYLNISEVFCIHRDLDKARACFDRAAALRHDDRSPIVRAYLDYGKALLLEAEHQYDAALVLATEIVERPIATVGRYSHRVAYALCARCHFALGHKGDALRCRRQAATLSSAGLVGTILSRQVEASLVLPEVEALTDQELSCLRLSANGQTSADIGAKLGITPRTVNFHFGKILRKLSAANRQEAIAKAVSANLITSPNGRHPL